MGPHPEPTAVRRSTRRAAAGMAPRVAALALAAMLTPAAAAAQDPNFHLPIPDIEEHLRDLPFEIVDWRGSRAPTDRTQAVVLQFEDASVIRVKWANAPPGGAAFNNEPRYEVAAYEIQKLFLDLDEYVVPPTVLRAFPAEWVAQQIPGTPRTFGEAASVVVALQYWLFNVTPSGFWDPSRAEHDSLYARHIGNMNLLTYLIRHGDSNVGNFLISSAENPRVFAVDNGVAFRALPGDRGHDWRDLRVGRLPASSVERLRGLTIHDLERALATLAEYRVVDGRLVPVTPGENLSANRGVRRRGGRVQLGLTAREIADIDRRRRTLLERIERGEIETF
jgi:hypothetical protein